MDKAKLKVYLTNSSSGEVVYELNIISVTNTQIEAILSGGHVGDFIVRVYHTDYGNS